MSDGKIQNLFQAVSLLRSPSQNRTVSEPKTYGLRTKDVRFGDGKHKRMQTEPVIQPKRGAISGKLWV